MAYGYQNLKLAGYEVESIETCRVEALMGEHTQLTLRAILKEEAKDDAIHTTNQAYPIEVYVEDKDEKISLFHGIVTNVRVRFQTNVYWLEIEAKSATYLMDITKHSRSFQDINMTYHEVIRSILRNYSNADCRINIPEIPIGHLIVQYEETDWQFIKRIVSTFNEGLFPAIEVPGIRFYVSVEPIAVRKMNIKRIDVRKDLDIYYHLKANSKHPVPEVAHTIYDIQADEIAYLMHNITLKGHQFYIKRLTYELEEGLLVNHYEVQLRQGLTEQIIFPMHLVGVALEGKILEPQEDKVRVHLDIDLEQDKNKAYWFPYSTMSASNDGSGWYCMPEVGDTVRVYFPTKYTKDAIALSSVSIYDIPSAGEDRMTNPDVKYLGTIYDKEMKLAPDGIRIACNGSVAVVKVGKDGKISLYGDKSVNVIAEENLMLKATNDLMMTALETIELGCDKGGKVLLDKTGNIKIQGTEVKVD